MSEPKITINGQEVTNAMAMTIRVSIENFAIDLEEGRMGAGITESYRDRIREIRTLIMQ